MGVGVEGQADDDGVCFCHPIMRTHTKADSPLPPLPPSPISSSAVRGDWTTEDWPTMDAAAREHEDDMGGGAGNLGDGHYAALSPASIQRFGETWFGANAAASSCQHRACVCDCGIGTGRAVTGLSYWAPPGTRFVGFEKSLETLMKGCAWFASAEFRRAVERDLHGRNPFVRLGLDPLSPIEWHHIAAEEITSLQGVTHLFCAWAVWPDEAKSAVAALFGTASTARDIILIDYPENMSDSYLIGLGFEIGNYELIGNGVCRLEQTTDGLQGEKLSWAAYKKTGVVAAWQVGDEEPPGLLGLPPWQPQPASPMHVRITRSMHEQK